MLTPHARDERAWEKELRKAERKLARAEEQLKNYERLVDRTQHMLNTRIAEVEAARHDLAVRTAELEESERRFRQLSDAAFEAILTHRDGRIIDCNEAATRVYGMPRDALIGSPILDRVHSAYRSSAPEWLDQATDNPVELNQLRGDGKTFPVEVRSRTITIEGRPAMVTVARDITAHKAMEEELRRMANSDPLTGVGNRRFFMERGNREFFRALRYQQPLSLIMLDIDHFKQINDTHGHDGGDLALQAAASVCKTCLRDSDVFGRLGGEEFAAVLPNTHLAGAASLAERLRAAIQAHRSQTDRGSIAFSVSIGVTSLAGGDQGIEALLSRADAGLYRAKSGGRNCVVAVHPAGTPIG